MNAEPVNAEPVNTWLPGASVEAATREDLMVLTPDSLAALTNRGLVKRAAREMDQAAPEITVDGDGAVRAVFADGVTASLPAGGLDAGACSCPATGVCRHIIGLVLAYQRHRADSAAVDSAAVDDAAVDDAAADPAAAAQAAADDTAAETVDGAARLVDWSPAAFTDDQLAAHLGARIVATARRIRRAGYLARVRRPTPADPVPSVELGTATVRFLVPHDLGFVLTDAAAGTRDDAVVLAVWAYRVADERAPDQPDVRVEVGGRAAERGGSGLESVLLAAEEVLRDGAVHIGGGIAAALADQQRGLDAAGLRWPLLALRDLSDQLAAYRDRSARYHPEVLARLILELHARHRAVVSGATLRAQVLGTDEAAKTPLRRVRLDSLGCRLSSEGSSSTASHASGPGTFTDGDQHVVEIFFAHADTATVLVLRRQWDGEAGDPAVGQRRIAGFRVSALATGNMVTESAVRSANRTLRPATSRVALTTVTPSQGNWSELPDRLLVRDIAALSAELNALPPRFIRPRVEAELVRVVPVAEVKAVSYAPGQQRLDAVIVDSYGNPATVTATHTVAAPGRLDAVAAALSGRDGPVRYVSGAVRRSGGGVVIDPLAFAVDGTIVVPDLAPATAADLGPEIAEEPEPLAVALAESRSLLAGVAHTGLLHLPPTYPDRLRAVADRLAKLGLHRVASDVERFAASLGPDPGEAAVRAWVDAYLRTEVTSDMC